MLGTLHMEIWAEVRRAQPGNVFLFPPRTGEHRYRWLNLCLVINESSLMTRIVAGMFPDPEQWL